MTNTLIQKEKLQSLTGALDQQGAPKLPRPFAQEILLLECNVAGTSYRDLEEIESHLQLNDSFTLCREPHNPHDPHAIAIFNEGGAHLGYIPRAKNEALARLLDAGKFLTARLVHKERRDRWLKLDIEIYLKEL